MSFAPRVWTFRTVVLFAGAALAALLLWHTASARTSTIRADLDADRSAETVRVVRQGPAWVRLRLQDRAQTRWLSPKARRITGLRVADLTGDHRRDVWFIARTTARAPTQAVAIMSSWNGKRVRTAFRYDSRKSRLGTSWAGVHVDLAEVDGGTAAAKEIRVIERSRKGQEAPTQVVRYYRLRGRVYVEFRPVSGARVDPVNGPSTVVGASVSLTGKPIGSPSPPVPPPTGGPTGPPGPTGPTGPPSPNVPGSGVPAGLIAPPEPAAASPSVFVTPSGNDGGGCTAAAPCATFDRAYKVAKPGQVVQVAGGSYPTQTLTADSSKSATGAVVAFRPAPGAAVTTGEIRCGRNPADLGANQIELADMTTSHVVTQRCSGFTLRRVHVAGGVFVDGSTRFSMVGGELGPGHNLHPDVQTVNGYVPRDVLFEGVNFHDWSHDDPEVHMECLQVSDVVGFTLRNSTFTNCDTFDIHVKGTNVGVQDIVIENNWFRPTTDGSGVTPSYYSMSVRDGKNVLIRNNASDQAFALPSESDSVSNWTVANNIAPLASNQCDNRIVWSHNLWSSTKCGSTDLSGSLGFVNPAAGDYRPTASSKARDNGDPKLATEYDLRGFARGTKPDIGPYEGS